MMLNSTSHVKHPLAWRKVLELAKLKQTISLTAKDD